MLIDAPVSPFLPFCGEGARLSLRGRTDLAIFYICSSIWTRWSARIELVSVSFLFRRWYHLIRCFCFRSRLLLVWAPRLDSQVSVFVSLRIVVCFGFLSSALQSSLMNFSTLWTIINSQLPSLHHQQTSASSKMHSTSCICAERASWD